MNRMSSMRLNYRLRTLWHGGRVMTTNQPVCADLLIRKRIARLNLCAIGKAEGIQACIRRTIAIDFNHTIINTAFRTTH